MQTLLIAFLGKVFEILLKYAIAWGEASIAKQQAVKKKMEEYQASKKEAVKKAEAYEADPSDSTRNNLP
jgi:hypothetical protein